MFVLRKCSSCEKCGRNFATNFAMYGSDSDSLICRFMSVLIVQVSFVGVLFGNWFWLDIVFGDRGLIT